MRDVLERNMLWIGVGASLAVALLVWTQRGPGDAANTLAALVAVVAVYYQGYLTRLTHGIDVLTAYDDRFDSGEYRAVRRDTASKILRLPGRLSGVTDEADDVLNFFTTIGLLTRRKVLDTEMVWALFVYPIHGYWSVAKDSITRSRQQDPTLLDDFVWLHDAVVRVEKHKRHCRDEDVEPTDPVEFLKEEAGAP